MSEFKFTLSDTKLLKSIVNIVSNISNDFCFSVNYDGLVSNGISTSHTVFYGLSLDASLFDGLSVTDECKVTVNVLELKKILGRGKPDDILNVSLVNDELLIEFDGESVRSFSLRLLDDYESDIKPPSIELPAEIELPISVIKDAVKDVQLFSDLAITIEVTPDKVFFTGKNDTSRVNLEYIHGEDIKESYKASYDIKLITDAINDLTFVDSVILQFGNNMPLKIKSILITGEEIFNTLVAPRVMDEEE